MNREWRGDGDKGEEKGEKRRKGPPKNRNPAPGSLVNIQLYHVIIV